MAAEICRTPISLFTLIDRNRQWFKSRLGLNVSETPRAISFCDHAIRQRELFVVEDASHDERFENNPLVTKDPGIRFYAGMPLEAPGGAMLGTLCVIDTVPRTLTASQRSALQVLASQVKVRMELRLERRKLEEALRGRQQVLDRLAGSERRFRTFMNNAPFISFMKDAKSRFVFYNDRMAERFKITSQEWLGKSDFDIWPKAVATELRRHDLEAMDGKRLIEKLEETSGPTVSGVVETTCWKTYKFPLWNERGEIMLGGIAIDVTAETAQKKALEEANEKLRLLAAVDALTGLANRRILEERIEIEYRYARRHGSPLAVLLLDMDDFKRINDERGHAAGDEVLRHVGQVMRDTMRATDMAARYGGEEFVVLLPGADTEGARLFADRLRAALRGVTASIGIASLDETIKSGNRLIQRADEAMYAAKHAGKDRVVTHREVIDQIMAELGHGLA